MSAGDNDRDLNTDSIATLTNNLGADAVIYFVNVSKTVETDIQLLRRRARRQESRSPS